MSIFDYVNINVSSHLLFDCGFQRLRTLPFGCAQELSSLPTDSPTALPYMTPSSPVDLDSRNGFLLEFKVSRNTVFSVKYAGLRWMRAREHAAAILFAFQHMCMFALWSRFFCI